MQFVQIFPDHCCGCHLFTISLSQLATRLITYAEADEELRTPFLVLCLACHFECETITTSSGRNSMHSISTLTNSSASIYSNSPSSPGSSSMNASPTTHSYGSSNSMQAIAASKAHRYASAPPGAITVKLYERLRPLQLWSNMAFWEASFYDLIIFEVWSLMNSPAAIIGNVFFLRRC